MDTDADTVAPRDTRSLREALGSFVSGVTVITCAEDSSRPVGVTVSSFCSLSLEPPMVLWCLARNARSTEAFLAAPFFAANVLAHDQWHVAEKFATRGADKFGAIDWDASNNGVPLLQGCAARFECLRNRVYEGGDHLIVTGLIQEFSVTEKAPLAYHRGRYALTHRDEEAAQLMAWQSW
jgi:flavin reductase (DIM6/NTAB) family NADH-FMN oxidoreductase RutF